MVIRLGDMEARGLLVMVPGQMIVLRALDMTGLLLIVVHVLCMPYYYRQLQQWV